MEQRKGITVFTLDAGGTNLVFSIIRDNVIQPEKIVLPASSVSLEEFIEKVITGFSALQKRSDSEVDAISFCFPGPADYEQGIIGDLENLPFFRGGVPLSAILENHFQVPVFINNDGDLFALGEAIGGLLTEINEKSRKKYNNLLGVTLGTGFGGGVVSESKLFGGDNSAAAEINRFSNFLQRTESVEEVLSIRGIRHLFAEKAEMDFALTPEPFEIYQIAVGKKKGNRQAALQAWKTFGVVLGDALANAVSITDSCVVIGGGLSGAYPVFLQETINQMNSLFVKKNGGSVPRMELTAYNWEEKQERKRFLKSESRKINVPGTNRSLLYYPEKKIAVGVSRLGTSEAVSLGAYAFALNKLGRTVNSM